MFHQVGDADGGGAAAAVFAVNDSSSPAVHLLLNGVGAQIEVAVKVLVGVIEDGHVQLPDCGGGGKRLLLGHVDAERHCPLLDELVTARRAAVADEQRLGDLTELQHSGRPGDPRNCCLKPETEHVS